MKTKKITAVMTVIAILLSLGCMFAFASELPESPHNYPDNYDNIWTYNYDGEAAGLLVTFSPDTKLYDSSEQEYEVIAEDTLESVFIGEKIFEDYIAVFDAYGDLVDIYYGSELAGKTIFVDGTSFSIRLRSNESGNDYGFKVTSVKPCTENCFRVTYHTNTGFGLLSSYTRTYYRYNTPRCEYYAYYSTKEKHAFAGWSTTPDGKVEFDEGEAFPLDMTDIDLYAVWVPVMLDGDEIFYFNNSRRYFDIDGNMHYYLSKEDYRMMQRNLYKNFGLGPVPSVIISTVLAFYPDHFKWQGSCYGMSTCIVLQHFGIIDMLTLQDVDRVYDLSPDEAVLSTINYYQSQAATSYLTENKALLKNLPSYQMQLRELYKSVSAGNMVLFTKYEGDAFISPGHTVVLVGAYDDAAGNHVLIAYDCNRPNTFRAGYYESRFIISPDYKTISYDGDVLGAINWTDDFSQFVPFDINGEGSPLTWYTSYFNHLIRTVKAFFDFFLSFFK